MLMKEINDYLNNWGDLTIFMDWKIQHNKDIHSSQTKL